MLDRLEAVRWDEMQDLIRQSYDMVAAKAPKKKSVKKQKARKPAPSRKRSRRL
jgi:predicted DNA-binding protein (MmcQ/YjbR family)